MNSCKRGIILLPLLLFLLIPSVLSKTVSFNDIEIVSPDVFYCQPIFKGDKCLVDVNIQVNNKNLIKINPKFQVDFSKDYEMKSFGINDVSYGITDSKATFISKDKLTLQKTNTINFKFWASENGEFNLTGLVYNDANFIGNVVLDPFINISVNSSYPSYHLINGINELYSDDEFENKTEISTELSDDDNATSYDTVVDNIYEGSFNELFTGTFDTDVGNHPKFVNVYGDVWVNVFQGLLGDGYIETGMIYPNGTIGSTITSLQFDASDCMNPDIIKLTDDVDSNLFAVVYTGKLNDGFVSTFNISSDGVTLIELEDNLEWATTDISHPKLVKVGEDGDTNVLVVAYSNANLYGTMKNVNVSGSGSVAVASTTTLFEATQSQYLDVINTSYDGIYAVVYQNQYGNLSVETVTITDDGDIVIPTVYDIGTDKPSLYPEIIHIEGDKYAVSYEGADDDGFITTFNINNSVSNGISEVDEYEFDTDGVEHSEIIKVSGGEDLYAVGYDTASGGMVKSFEIDTSGNIIRELQSYNFSSSAEYTFMDNIVDGILGIVYHDISLNDGKDVTLSIALNDLFNSKALSIYFDYPINGSQFYWLEVLINDSADLTVHPYINGTDINSTNSKSFSVSEGVNRLRIDDMVYSEYNFPFRIYTNISINISEVYLIEEVEYEPLTAYLEDYYALNSSGGRIDEFSTDTLEEIEKLRLNFTINISYFDETINYWYFNFSMNGSNACALGNKQSSQCYEAYNNEWIQYIKGNETATFRDEGHTGDYIDATITGLGTEEINIFLEIDEHYQNVFKNFNAGFNFSLPTYLNSSNISGSNFMKVEVNQSLIPTDADQYKLDFRVTHNNPEHPLEVYACNSSYATGHPFDFDGCNLIAEKYYYELQDTDKFRGIFTDNLIIEIGDLKYIVMEQHTNDTSQFYAIKSYKVTNPAHSIKWEHSTDDGSTWTQGTEYESELNINWYYDGADKSAFIYNIYAESNTTSHNLIGNITWDIDAVNNYPPVISITSPSPSESITQPYLIEMNIDDTNTDNLNSTLFLDGDIIAGDLNYSVSYYWDSFVNESTYLLTLLVCELGTPELYCVNDSHTITITNYCTEDINLFNTPLEACDDVTLTYNVSYYYIDSNYGTCCNVTGLSSDCNILNETLYSNYTQLDDCSSIDCLFDSTPYLKFFDKKIPLLCEVNKNASYDFLTYVKADDQIIQTNPERTLIERYGEYNTFRSENGIVNLYYRSDILRPDRNITVIVEGQNGIFYQEMDVIPTYKDPYELQDRLFYTWDNAGLIIGGVFIILILGLLVVFLIRHLIREVKR